MSTYFYEGSMANRTIDARESDVAIRIQLGLRMVDDAADFLGAFILDRDEQIAERDEQIAYVRDALKQAEEDEEEAATENKELRSEIAGLKFDIKRLEQQLNATKEQA